jgi:hypothetical protein
MIRRYTIMQEGTKDSRDNSLFQLAIELDRLGVNDEEFDCIADLRVGEQWTAQDKAFTVLRTQGKG